MLGMTYIKLRWETLTDVINQKKGPIQLSKQYSCWFLIRGYILLNPLTKISLLKIMTKKIIGMIKHLSKYLPVCKNTNRNV